VEAVRVTEEDEYFPPPRELREAFSTLDIAVALLSGADPLAARALGGPFSDDRSVGASDVLAELER
jgi:4-hydroxy-3-methylbut-2-enyl diphosphate reductase